MTEALGVEMGKRLISAPRMTRSERGYWNHNPLGMFAEDIWRREGHGRDAGHGAHTFRGVPPNAAGRFSRKARTPSAKSGVNPSSR